MVLCSKHLGHANVLLAVHDENVETVRGQRDNAVRCGFQGRV